MTATSELNGHYQGRAVVRAGREQELSPTERNRYLKKAEPTRLELRADGTFVHNGALTGRYELRDGRIRLTPQEFGGKTLPQMRAAAEGAGRAFGLAFLFDPFELCLGADGALESTNPTSLIYTRYERDAEISRIV